VRFGATLKIGGKNIGYSITGYREVALER